MKSLSSFDLSPSTFHVHRIERAGITGQSKGNQLKWKSDGKYIKLDCLGYESIAEYMVSFFLRYTNLDEDEFVKYQLCNIVEDGRLLGRGCWSEDFVDQEDEISIKSYLENNLLSAAISYNELRECLFEFLKYDCKKYLDKILCIDAITFNEDRHFDNISFLVKEGGEILPAPIYDNGASCLSDVISYPFSTEMLVNLSCVQAKPFSISFEEQLHYVNPILVRYNDFKNDVIIKSKEEERAYSVIMHGLEKMRGKAWEEIS